VAVFIGILVGTPLGIFLGRRLWILFGHEISAVPEPTVPALVVVFVGIAAIVLANVVAAIPGRYAAQTPTALIIRAEQPNQHPHCAKSRSKSKSTMRSIRATTIRRSPMNLTSHLSPDRRDHVETRLRGNLMAWLTTVRPNGQPESVPVWFLLQDDETILVYSEPGKVKLHNIDENPKVSLSLDVTDLGRDVIRVEGTAKRSDSLPPASEVRGYTAKYAERIGAMFGTADHFAELFSVPVLITPTRLYA
jgi:PPOX class probable F420-dependent enzyme